FLDEGVGPQGLVAEQAILGMVFREQVAKGTVVINRLPRERLSHHCVQHARRSRCDCLAVATKDQRLEIEGVGFARLVLAGPCPALAPERDGEARVFGEGDDLACWSMALESWLRACL